MSLIFLILLTSAYGALGQSDGNVKSIEMTASPLTVDPVSLSCIAELQPGAAGSQLRIQRMTENGYTWFARISRQNGIEINNLTHSLANTGIFDNMQVEGNLSQGTGMSRIFVTWPTVDKEDIFGLYVCDIVYNRDLVYGYGRSDEVEYGGAGEMTEHIIRQGEQLEATQEQVDTLQENVTRITAQINSLMEAASASVDMLQQVTRALQTSHN